MKTKWLYLILFIFSFIISVFLNFNKINVPYLGSLYKSVWVDVIYSENKDLSLINIDNYEINRLKIDNNHYLYKPKTTGRVKSVNILNKNKIKQVIIYIDKKIQFDSFNNIDNTKNLLDKTIIIILSFFYNFNLYLFSYLFLFLFLYNFKVKINTKLYFWIFIILAFLLRLAQLNYIPFWDDEIYTLMVSAPYSPISALFNDPGNPPLYFILFKIYRLIFHNPIFYRFSSVIVGIIFCFVFYFYIKKLQGKTAALTGLFFCTFAVALIYYSQEIRCYMLLMLLAILCSYYLFNFKKYPYLISSVAIMHLHFFGMFYVFSNFIFGLFYFKNKKKINFIKTNIVAGILFAPCLIYKIITLPPTFNTWIDKPMLLHYIQTIKAFCGHIIIALLFSILMVYIFKKAKLKKKVFIGYNAFLIIFLTLIVAIFSYLVKPIFVTRYFYIIYPCYLALCTTISKNIILNIIIFILFISKGYLIHQNLFCNHNLYLEFIYHTLDNSKTNYVIMTDTTQGYREFVKNNIKPIYIKINTGIKVIDPLKYGVEKGSVCYVLNLYLEDNTYNEAKNIELYKTPLGVFAKVEY